MRDWTEGYHQGSDYAHGYQRELNPLRLALHFLNAGLAPPTVSSACELGFGQGLSMNLHAAGSMTPWYGTDFNPAQAGFARELAAASGAAAHFFDQPFAEFCARPDLPDFDFICMHGIWSWINDANRSVLVDFLRRKLRVGGVLYVSYNTRPGHAAFTAMQEVVTRYADWRGTSGLGIVSRMNDALDFADKLLAMSPAYAQANPDIAKRLSVIRGQDRTYVAHEYNNREWVPTSVSRVAEWLAPAKLEYACSARYFDMVDHWNLSREQQALLADVPDPVFRETLRDFMMNQWFRKDYWVKGARPLTRSEKTDGFRRQRVVLIHPRSLVTLKAEGTLGKFAPPEGISDPILDLLADYRPRTLGQIETAVRDKGIGLSKIVEVVMTLMESGDLSVAQDEPVTRTAKKQTDKLNAYLSDKAQHRVTTGVFASPITGGGLTYEERLMHFFWLAASKGKKQPVELAAHAAHMFLAEESIVLDAEKLYLSPQEGGAALLTHATFFGEKILPLFKALQVL